jgi:hypothetical protein
MTCARCGSEDFEHVANPGPTDQAICSRCRARFTYDELAVALDAQFGKDVDAALSRVRDVNRRFPHR